MKKYTLSIIFSDDCKSVLICDHKKLNRLNFIGGKIDDNEDILDASYRELKEETGITDKDVTLDIVASIAVESVESVMVQANKLDAIMTITTAVLNKPVDQVKLTQELNPLRWAPIKDILQDKPEYKNLRWSNFMRLAITHLKVMEVFHEV